MAGESSVHDAAARRADEDLERRLMSLMLEDPNSPQLHELLHLLGETPASLCLPVPTDPPADKPPTQDPFAALESILSPFSPPEELAVEPPASFTDETLDDVEASLLAPDVVRAILQSAPPPPRDPSPPAEPVSASVSASVSSVQGPPRHVPANAPRQYHPNHPNQVRGRPETTAHRRPGNITQGHPEGPFDPIQPPRERPRDQEREPQRPRTVFRSASSKLLQDRQRARKRNMHGGRDGGGREPRERRSNANGPTDLVPEGNLREMGRAILANNAKRQRPLHSNRPNASSKKTETTRDDLPEIPNVDPRFVEMIMNEMLDSSNGVDWDDIAGLHFAKQCVMEAIVWPMKRPDIFTGLRGPPKGLLLFGPPGTGKTLIGRAIASRSGAKFFNISASSLVSKWVGEGEKMVRALFAVARVFQPSVVFIDEIDSMLCQRSDAENEGSRRIKTEFLVQMDGAGTSRDDRVLVVGATNRPQELDEAARRRLVKRLYIPLPDDEARRSLVTRLLAKQAHSLAEADFDGVVGLSKGYSGSDMYALCAEAALGPVRDLGEAIGSIDASCVRPISLADFKIAARMVRASVSGNDLDGYVEWNTSFGSFPMTDPKADAPAKDDAPPNTAG